MTPHYSSDTPDLFGDNLQLSFLGMSSITHNIILLRHLERHAQTVRRLSILRLRDSGHDNEVREFPIADDGIHLAASVRAQMSPRKAVASRSQPKSPTKAAKKRRAQAGMKQRILIVDDEYGIADIVAEILMERGYEVSLAINNKLLGTPPGE